MANRKAPNCVITGGGGYEQASYLYYFVNF